MTSVDEDLGSGGRSTLTDSLGRQLGTRTTFVSR
jgi:hypothetical protein